MWVVLQGGPAEQEFHDMLDHPPHILALQRSPQEWHLLVLNTVVQRKVKPPPAWAPGVAREWLSQEGWSALGDGRPPSPALGLYGEGSSQLTLTVHLLHSEELTSNFYSDNPSSGSDENGGDSTGNLLSDFTLEFL